MSLPRNFLVTLFLMHIGLTSITAADMNYARWNNPRDYQPIILNGVNIPELLYQPINQLYAYTYTSAENGWKQIPFQIDKMDISGEFRKPFPNETFSENDELIFMARDMGDKAPNEALWIDDVNSKKHQRIEISATDPIDEKQAWIYIYRSSTNIIDFDSTKYEMEYAPSNTSSGADTIKAKTYIQGHNAYGIANSWILKEGSHVDILDRQKIYFSLYYFGFIHFPVDEKILESAQYSKIDSIKIRVGPIRILREIFWTVDLQSPLIPAFSFGFPQQFYPYSIESRGISANIPAKEGLTLRTVRESFDLNSSAINMKFYNFYNKNGLTIDGKGGSSGNDGIINQLDCEPAINWYLITGSQGSFTFLFKLNALGDTRNIYYKDTPDAAETGEDKMHYGDTGIEINGTNIIGNISLAYKIYYSESNKPYAFGDSLGNNFKNPFSISAALNSYPPEVAVSIPDTSAPQQATIQIPIMVGDVTDLNIYTAFIEISYDVAVLNAVNVSNVNTIASLWTDISMNKTENKIQISMNGSEPLQGKGVLIYIEYDVFGPDQSSTLLAITSVNFNNGIPFAVGTGGTFTVQGVVPVELASFQSEVEKNTVHLTWVTASESNNYGFEIQRKSGTKNDWHKVAFIEGAGTSSLAHNYRYRDNDLSPGTYCYRLKQIDADGSYEFSAAREVVVQAPRTFALEQNYPNPFNPITRISYQLPEIAAGKVDVSLIVYNLLGVKIRTLVVQSQTAGYYVVSWDGRNDNGALESSGTYVYRLRAGDCVATRRMVLLK